MERLDPQIYVFFLLFVFSQVIKPGQPDSVTCDKKITMSKLL